MNSTEVSMTQSTHSGDEQHAPTLRDSVETAMNNYFQNLDGQDVNNVYQMVLSEVEAPMLEVVMRYTRDNQTRASQILGLNRGTLRKKLKQYGLL
ncbi:DNA-binding transcriptional regulator Fis [Natronospirillum operosum]|nr:DNA-binding transcriptional regulator Fis [Natronospirillum operosum]